MQIGVVGLGSMGTQIAARLIDAGHSVRVWNRSKDKAAELVNKGAELVKYPGDTANGDMVITILADNHALETVLYENGGAGCSFIESQSVDTVHVSMSTISADLCRQMTYVSRQKAKKFIAAPVMGRPDVAQRGELLVMAAGEQELINQCAPAFKAFARAVHTIGDEPVKGAIAKLSANFMLSALIETYAETFALLRKNGIDHKKFQEIIGIDFFKSPIYEKYGNLIVSENFAGGAFTALLQEKDTRLALEAAIQSKVPMPLLSAVENAFLTAIGQGFGEQDPCVLARVAAINAGVS
jgi:3-hydroxyisobutyrate dehydrogenase-like beta-hydroxyacid dehydrogenase